MYRFFKTATACFIILMLLLAATLGLAAVKRQQATGTLPTDGTYISLPFEFSVTNQDTTELVKRLLENTAVFAVLMLELTVCVYAAVWEYPSHSLELSKKSTVVLLE